MQNLDDSWLADDEGNLRPEIARQLSERRFPPIAAAAAPPPVGQPRTISRAVAPAAAGLAFIVVILLLVHALRLPSGRIITADATLRTGPAPAFPALGTFLIGTTVKIKEASDGWYHVKYADDDGWVFASHVVRRDGPWHGPGILLSGFSVPDGATTRSVVAGTWVVITDVEKKLAFVQLEDGTSLSVAPQHVVSVEVLP